MKKLIIISLMFLSVNIFAQKQGNEKTFTWTVAHKDTCWRLDDIGQNMELGLQIVFSNMLNGYFKLYGKSGQASSWMQYGSASLQNAGDSINIASVVAVGANSGGWEHLAPIFNNLRLCFFHVTDTVGTISIYQTLMKK